MCCNHRMCRYLTNSDLFLVGNRFFFSSGGNQRELARAKNMKKQQESAKKKGKDTAFHERKERFVSQM